MSYTFGDQLDKLSSLLGDSNTTSDDMFPIAQRMKEINRGEVNLAVDSKDLLGYATSTVSGTTLTLPSDFVEMHIFVLNNVVLTNDYEISIEDWARYYNIGTTDPYYYFWPDASGTEKLNFFGSSYSGNTYHLFYFKKPTTELSATTDTSSHREEFREGSVYYAAAELMKQIGKAQQSNEFRMAYEAMVAKADAWARTKYIKKNYTLPDFGPIGTDSTDIQGRTYMG